MLVGLAWHWRRAPHTPPQIIAHYRWELLYSGEYGRPPQHKAHSRRRARTDAPQPWLAQMGLYLLIAVFEKSAMSLFMLASFWQAVRSVV